MGSFGLGRHGSGAYVRGFKVRTVTSVTPTILHDDNMIIITGAAAATVTLPESAANAGRVIIMLDTGAGGLTISHRVWRYRCWRS